MEMVDLLAGLAWDPEIRGFLAVLAGGITWMGSVWLLLSTNSGPRLGTLLALAGFFAWMAIMGSIWWIYGIGWVGDAPVWEQVEIVEGTDEEGHLTFAALDEANELRSESLPSAHDRGKRLGPEFVGLCLLYTSPSPRDVEESRMPSSA